MKIIILALVGVIIGILAKLIPDKGKTIIIRLALTLSLAFFCVLILSPIQVLSVGSKVFSEEKRVMMSYELLDDSKYLTNNGINGFYIRLDSTRTIDELPVPVLWDDRRQEVVVGKDQTYARIGFTAYRDEMLVEAVRSINDSIFNTDLYVFHDGNMTIEKNIESRIPSFFTDKLIKIEQDGYRDGLAIDDEYIRIDGKPLSLLQRFWLNDILSLCCLFLLSLVIAYYPSRALFQFLRKRRKRSENNMDENKTAA